MTSTKPTKKAKIYGIVSYFTFIGLFISIAMNIGKRNAYVYFHARQMLGLIIMLITSNVCERYINSWLGTSLWLVTFLSWLYCLVYAFSGQAKLLPVLGGYFQNWFKSLN